MGSISHHIGNVKKKKKLSWPGLPVSTSLKWVLRKCPGEVKVAGIILSECRMVYKNMVASKICPI